jgi:catechol 2,3-dioxygenase-like lactoylglutathione lyase family enzyme
MITGFHTIIYSDDAEATRAFFRDVLAWPSVDAGGGWLIFKTPPTEMGVHPTLGEGGERWATIPHAQLSVMCDDLTATIADLQGKGVDVADEVRNEGFGLVTEIQVPGAGSMMLYQPLHPVAHEIEG